MRIGSAKAASRGAKRTRNPPDLAAIGESDLRVLLKMAALLLAAGLFGQGLSGQPGEPVATPQQAGELATRMVQLMESTAVAVPGLARASEPVKQNPSATVAAMQSAPGDPALTWEFLNQVKAYLALANSIPRPDAFPAAADRQDTELREDLDRMQRYFGTILQLRDAAARQRDADPNNIARYAEANRKLLPAGALPRVVFLGDSITDGWRLNEYFTGSDFVNRGIGGQTTSQMLARFRQDVVALNPKVVAILAGTNDIANGVAVSQIEDNLAAMGDLAKAHGIKVLLASITPVSDYHKDADPRYEMTKGRPPATILAIDRWIQTLCLTQGYTYVDYYSAMVDPAGQLRADLSDDGLHPNAKGYRVMSPVALAAVSRVVAHLQDAPQDAPAKRRGLLR